MQNIHTLARRIVCCGFFAAASLALTAVGETGAWTLTLDSTDNDTVGSITDGNWQIAVAVWNGTQRQLMLGTTRYVQGQSAPTNGNAICRDTDGNVIGSGLLDLRGTITRSSDQSEWTIVTLGRMCLSGSQANGVKKNQGTYYAPFTELWLPDTLQTFGQHGELKALAGCGAGKSPNLVAITGNSSDAFYNNTFMGGNITNLYLNLPKLKVIGGYDFSDMFLKGTDVSNWDLSSVVWVGINVSAETTSGGWTSSSDLDRNATRTFFRGKHFRGTLHLPSLTGVSLRMFENCDKLGGLELGDKGTLTSIGTNATLGCSSLTNVVLKTDAKTVNLYSGAFAAANLKSVTFGAYAPTFKDSDLVFGTEDTPAKSIVFFAPHEAASFSRIRSCSREVTDAERAAVRASWGAIAADRLVGVIPAHCFHTAHEQYLADSGATRPRLSLSVYDPRFAGDAAAVVTPAPDADGCYAYGTEVTVRATPGADGTFKKWIGFPDGAEETSAEITFTLKNDLALRAIFVHNWTYYSTEGVVSNAVWTLKAYANNVSLGRLTLGNSQSLSTDGNAFTDRGSGILDLNGTIVSDDASKTWTITALGQFCLRRTASGAYSKSGTDYPTALILPETLVTPGTQPVRYGLEKTLVMILPNMTSELGQDWMSDLNLTNALFRLPKTRVLRFQNGLKYDKTVDVTPWDLSSVTNVAVISLDNGSLQPSFFAGRNFSGTLHLPSLTDVSSNAFLNCANMLGVELGTCTQSKSARKPVRFIRHRAFSGCTSLDTLTLYSDSDLQVCEDAFLNASALCAVRFTGRPPSVEALDRILQGVATPSAGAAKQAVIYGSRNLDWAARASTPTADELLKAPPVVQASDLLGVYETADGARKAWIVHASSPADPVGFTIILR